MYGDLDEGPADLSSFRPVTLTVKSFFKQVNNNLLHVVCERMDNLHYRLIFCLDNKNKIPGKNLLKVVRFQNLVEKML